MTRLQSISIRNFRGILKLDLDFEGKSYVIQGPNGSGKSGVIDAIEFALTGNISRLTGAGTAGLTARRHGPHVDFAESPGNSSVSLTILCGTPVTAATIERSLDCPRSPRVTPDEPAVWKVLEQLGQHPELVLSRREIIKYILAEAGKRSEQIQLLLKLDRVERFRAALKTASNNLARETTAAQTTHGTAQTALKTALSLQDVADGPLLAEVNRLRALAGAEPLSALSQTSRLDSDVPTPGGGGTQRHSKKVIEADLRAFRDLYGDEPSKRAATLVSGLAEKLAELGGDPELAADLGTERLFELALEHFDGSECPVCDTPVDDHAFRELLRQKQDRLTRGKRIKEELLASASGLATRLQTLERPLMALDAAASTLEAPGTANLATALASVVALRGKLVDLEQIIALNLADLSVTTTMPTDVATALGALVTATASLPLGTEEKEAAGRLAQAQTRFKDLQDAKLALAAKTKVSDRAARVLEIYEFTTEAVLNGLYGDVRDNFTSYYRQIHPDDESAFDAEIKRDAGGVDLTVDFYGRGPFPPAAYHSEGHQDGMGLCLYLALMKQVMGSDFSFAVFDDVVMSVDAAHRQKVCRLLVEVFPDTQFILTTHDKVWLGQIHASGLVRRKATALFSRWSVEHGPYLADPKEVWEEIQGSLDAGNVPAAAAALRRYLEEVSFEIADLFRAPIPLRADASYEMRELLDSVIHRWKELLGKAIAAAQSWKKDAKKAELLTRRDAFAKAVQASNVEQWAVNPAVHYNQWANFTREDFAPVVEAFRTLLTCFQCPSCKLWLYLEPASPSAKTIRCPCGDSTISLDPRPEGTVLAAATSAPAESTAPRPTTPPVGA